MTVVLFDKKAETYVHIENVTVFERRAEAIGFSEKRFRYIYHIRQDGSIYGKIFPCNQYTIHKIIERF